MLRRNAFVVVVLIGLILSAAFTSWTQDNSEAGRTTRPFAKSAPPDTTNYSQPATTTDRAVSSKSVAVLSSPGFTVVEVPNSGGGEPDIAINPLNLNQIVIHHGFGGWTGDATNFISKDGGITWTGVNQIPPPTGVAGVGGPNDITQDYGMDGNLYGAYLTNVPAGVGCGSPFFDVYSASNTNPILGGLFSYFTVAGVAQLTDFNGSQGCADQPWLLTNVDPTTAGQTNTYVGYDDDSGSNMRVSVALGTQPPNFVTDNVAGVTSGGGINQGFRLAVDPRTGAVYSLYQICTSNCGGTPKGIGYKLNRSLDAGATWTLNGSGTGVQVASGTTVQPTPKFGTVNALLGGIDHAAVDPTTGNVFVVFGGDNGTFDPILGSDGNAVFIKEITFDNSSPSNAIPGSAHQVSLPGAQAALPSVAVAPNGTVGVLYTSFDGFSVDGFPIYSGHFAYSTDAGATFTDKTLLTFLSTTKDDGTARQRFLGDYQQLKVVNDLPPANAGATFYGVFTGNGAALGDPIASNQAIFFKVTLAPQINLSANPLPIGNVCEGSTASAQLEVSDTGADNLLINSITRASGSTDISLAAGPSFPVNVSPDANFNFTFACTPTSTGVKSAIFNIASNDPVSPTTPLTVTCNTASGTIDVTGSGNFGTATCFNPSAPPPTQTVQVNNVGTCTLNVASAMINCSDFTLVNPGEFPAAISPDSSLPIAINFTPTSAGPKSCNLTITSDTGGVPGTPTVIPLTGNTPTGTASLTFPTGLTFPPTLIQTSAACSSSLGIPITNAGTCPVQINSVTLTQASSPPDYSLTGLPGLPVNLGGGQQLGSGDLDVVFAPFTLARESAGNVNITFVNDPITGATTTTTVPFCGEAVRRGVRVLVTEGGVPVSVVKRIILQNAFTPEQQTGQGTIKTLKNVPLQTISGTPPCPSFQFQGEFGGISDAYQLKDGGYRIKVKIKEGKKTKTKVVRVTVDLCSFTPNVVVAFP